jgi:hypothetical protein
LNFWVHSAGLQIDAPLFNIGSYIFQFKLNGKVVYANTADFDIDLGYLGTLAFEVTPGELNSGFVFGISSEYFNQSPSRFDDYNTVEFLGYLGYRF